MAKPYNARIDWLIAKKEYILGATPAEIAVRHNTTAQMVSNRIYTHDWKKEKLEYDQDLSNRLKDTIDTLMVTAFSKITTMLNSATLTDSNLIQCFKALGDLSGMKKETLRNEIITEKDINIIINRKPIKKKD